MAESDIVERLLRLDSNAPWNDQLAVLEGAAAENTRLRGLLRLIKLHGELACVDAQRLGYSGGKKPATKEVFQFPRHMLADIDAALGGSDEK